jgi:hypothetical protein
MNSLNYLNALIAKHPSIKTLRVFKFTFKNKFQDIHKVLTEDEKEAMIKVMSHKEAKKISFWEAALDLMSNGMSLSERMLEHAIFHNKNKFYKDYEKQMFLDFIKDDVGEDIAINSKVMLDDGQVMHIPMLDFELPFSPHTIETVEKILKVFNQKGMILNSGKSFHFIGYTLVTENELLDMLAKFILVHPISDKAWAAHQIIERSASLRISKKYGSVPSFIKEV